MKILALEFSSARRAGAVCCPSLDAPDEVPCAEVAETGAGNHPFALIERALAQARIEREEITALAIGLGPGSYTGIRAAIAIARGWELALPVRLLGIRTTDVLAAQASDAGMQGDLRILIDAQRREFYLGSYHIHADRSWAETAPLRIITLSGAQTLAASGVSILTPDSPQLDPGVAQVFPSAATLARLAARQLASPDPNEPSSLEPVYLREPQFVKAPEPRVLPAF